MKRTRSNVCGVHQADKQATRRNHVNLIKLNKIKTWGRFSSTLYYINNCFIRFTIFTFLTKTKSFRTSMKSYLRNSYLLTPTRAQIFTSLSRAFIDICSYLKPIQYLNSVHIYVLFFFVWLLFSPKFFYSSLILSIYNSNKLSDGI